ncbi:Arf-GAP with GTPase [Striga asiatica]|uniref:Arf-GAP with GTPase n=1 Tax=Striga asiatica TaxID=4170 RepID=A0A5A7QX69_STRAF|nr:Arf-GAP with GTPase [Striga asiatica]
MSDDTKKRSNGAGGAAGGAGFRAKLDHYLYSGEKKHVFAGIAIFGVIFGIPWYLMNQVYGKLEAVRSKSYTGPVEMSFMAQSINLIKITWKRPIKLGVPGFLLVHPRLNEDNKSPSFHFIPFFFWKYFL